MRTFWLVAFLLVGCRGSADGTDAGVVTPKAPAVDSAEDEIEPPPDAEPDAGPSATLRDVDGGAAPTAMGGGVLLCKIHSVWAPPRDFAATSIQDGVVARHGQELVAFVRPPHTDDAYARAAGAFVDGQLAWDAPTLKRIDDWHAEGTAHGRATGLVVATRTLYAGIDPKTGKGRPGSDHDVVWLAIAPTETRADELLADAKEHAKTLTDHACACGYDCEKRR